MTVSDELLKRLHVDHLRVSKLDYHDDASRHPEVTVSFYVSPPSTGPDPWERIEKSEMVAWYGTHSGYTWDVSQGYVRMIPPDRYIGEIPGVCVWELVS